MPKITLTQAMDAYYLHGDRTLLQQYEAEKAAEKAAEEAAKQAEAEAIKRVQTLASRYPELTKQEEFAQVLETHDRLAEAGLLTGDMITTPNGRKISPTAIASIAESRRPGAQPKPQAEAKPTKETPKPKPRAQTTGLTEGEDPLLDRPEVRRALAQQPGYGKTKESQYAALEQAINKGTGSLIRVRNGRVYRG